MTFTAENITALIGMLGAVGGVLLFIWRVFKTCGVFLKDHEEVKGAIKVIKTELTPNGGSSLKDIVSELKKTCHRIEIRQRLSDQRSKAALHYSIDSLFEINSSGALCWSNDSFAQMFQDLGDIFDGHDWITIVHDDCREDFLKEFKSCLEMSRKIDITTKTVHDKDIRFVGFPYKISAKKHGGFLLNCYYL